MEILIYCLVGACAGLLRLLISGKGIIPLPRIETKHGHKFINLGFVTPLIIGAIAGWLAPSALGVNSIVAFLSAYGGVDFIENLIERMRKLPRVS